MHLGFMETVKLHSIDFVAPSDGECALFARCIESRNRDTAGGFLASTAVALSNAASRVHKRLPCASGTADAMLHTASSLEDRLCIRP